MNKIKSQRGQAIILLAFAIVGLVGFAALAIDGGRVLSDKRHAQNAADTAAFAAALAKIQGGNISTAGLSRALSNGYDNNSTLQDVVVNNPPASGPYAGNNEYVQVIITSTINTTFARVIGRSQVTNVVEAVARAQTTSSTYAGAAIAGLKTTGTAVQMNGNINLTVTGSGVFSNSTSNCSMDANGNGTYNVDTSYSVATGGTLCKNGNLHGDITDPANTTAGAQIPYPPPYNIPAPTITCSGNGSVTGNTVNPGNFNSNLNLNGNGNYTFSPGNYCFNNGVTINGNINVTANNVNFRINASTFTINGNSTFTCSNVIVYGAGGSGIEFNGTGVNNCSNIVFYMAAGKATWNGNASNTFAAPTSGTYKGLLLYMPYGNSNSLTINGNSSQHLSGSIIAVSSDITINGNSGTFASNTQFIGYTVTLNGNAGIQLNYQDLYNPPLSPTIELTK